MSSHTEIFETIAELYYKRFGRLAPGKSEAVATMRDSSDEENRRQYEVWHETEAFDDAIKRIISLENEVKELQNKLDDD